MQRTLKHLLYAAVFASVSLVHAASCPELDSLPRPDDGIVPKLGYGTDWDREVIKQQSCLNFTENFIDSGRSTLNSRVISSFEDVFEKLTITLGGSVSYAAIFKASASSTYEKIFHQTQFSKSFVLDYDIKFGTADATFDANDPLNTLNALGKQLSNDACGFKRYCGNHYVCQTQKGANISVKMDFNFSSEYHKNQFTANASAGIAGLNICCKPFSADFNASINKLSTTTRKNSSVRIEAIQNGGNVEELSRILGGSYAFTCSLDALDDCTKALDAVAEYVASEDFITGVRERPAITAYKNCPYEFIYGVPILPKEATEAVQAAREQLVDKYQELLADQEILRNTLSLTLKEERRLQLENLLAMVEADTETVRQVGELCLNNLGQCVDKAEQALLSVRVYAWQMIEANPFTDGVIAHYPFDSKTEDRLSELSASSTPYVAAVLHGDDNYTDGRIHPGPFYVTSYIPNFAQAGYFHDCVTSVEILSNCSATLYEHGSGTGRSITLGSHHSNLSWAGFNDIASSVSTSCPTSDGITFDSSGNNNYGVVYGSSLTQDRFEKIDSAFIFESGKFIDMPSIPSTSYITVGAWIKPDTENGMIIGRIQNKSSWGISGQYILYLEDAKPSMNIKVNNKWYEVQSSVPVPLGKWSLINATWDGNSLRLFINGKLFASNSNLPAGELDQIEPSTTKVGFWWSRDPKYFVGAIDDIRIHNRALSATEIQQLYNATSDSDSGSTNIPPLATFQTSATQGTAPLTITVDAGYSEDADGSIASYAWQISKMLYDKPVLQDQATGQIASFTFDQAGEYLVSLLVTDDQGATSLAETRIVVTADNGGGTATLNVQLQGNGSVTGNGINCGTDCSESFPQGSSVTLTASPDKDMEFVGWQGVAGCGSSSTCVVNLSADVQATAVFQAVGNTGGTSNTSGTCKLVNISSRLNVQGGAKDGYAGFMLSGSGTQKVLLRGIAVDGGTDPVVQLLKFNGKSWDVIFDNNEWENDGNANALRNLAQNYQLPDRNGNDAGVLLNLEAGLYTAQLSSGGRSGSQVIGVDALNEAGATLVNISTRAYVSGGANDLFAGFAISGNNCSLPVLLRGIAVDSGTNPALTLLKLNGAAWDKVASNDAWQSHSSANQIRALASNMQLPDRNGNDAGMLLNLEPGVYSLQLSSGGLAGLMTVGVDAQ